MPKILSIVLSYYHFLGSNVPFFEASIDKREMFKVTVYGIRNKLLAKKDRRYANPAYLRESDGDGGNITMSRHTFASTVAALFSRSAAGIADTRCDRSRIKEGRQIRRRCFASPKEIRVSGITQTSSV